MPESTYSPRLRTGVILCGAGTAGAYHAGVLKALTEAGIKLDVLAAHGAGVMTALAAAIDGGAKVWDPAGPWTAPALKRAYRWRAALRISMIGLIAAAGVFLVPALVLIVAGFTYAAGIVAVARGPHQPLGQPGERVSAICRDAVRSAGLADHRSQVVCSGRPDHCRRARGVRGARASRGTVQAPLAGRLLVASARRARWTRRSRPGRFSRRCGRSSAARPTSLVRPRARLAGATWMS